jgi:hypothetical protein
MKLYLYFLLILYDGPINLISVVLHVLNSFLHKHKDFISIFITFFFYILLIFQLRQINHSQNVNALLHIYGITGRFEWNLKEKWT